ncbi:hypothetical protein [Amycolatopsis sp. DG1A-15b]|uniref:hypothetical protein n=1 Tax=Amycolatopsis sp. DG1A-15b TaxID=3052846 RepID=UPI00255B679D|nr:hypothetical protein [Amycolatopsis sp. DG1A-15b]WIX93179.1 hypothetical protein QRY02_23150 [Amycolatopsis sp. DG1A-15b]
MRASANSDGGARFDQRSPGTPTALAGYPASRTSAHRVCAHANNYLFRPAERQDRAPAGK